MRLLSAPKNPLCYMYISIIKLNVVKYSVIQDSRASVLYIKPHSLTPQPSEDQGISGELMSICQKPVIDWYCMLLVSRSGLVEENAVEIFYHYDVHLSFSFLK